MISSAVSNTSGVFQNLGPWTFSGNILWRQESLLDFGGAAPNFDCFDEVLFYIHRHPQRKAPVYNWWVKFLFTFLGPQKSWQINMEYENISTWNHRCQGGVATSTSQLRHRGGRPAAGQRSLSPRLEEFRGRPWDVWEMDGWMDGWVWWFLSALRYFLKNESRDTSGLVEFDFASTIFGLKFSGQKR